MCRTTLHLIVTVVLICACGFATAQKFQPKSIQFKGDPEYSDEELLAAAGLKTGVVLTVAEMNDHFERLRDSGVFANVLYKFDGQDLIYQLTPATELYPIRIENLPLTPGKDLDAQLHARLPLYHGKVPSEGTLLDGVRQGLQDLLAERGIPAKVTAMPFGTPGTKDVTAINFVITSPPVLIGAIQAAGVSPEMQAKVTALEGHTSGMQFDTGNSERNIEQSFQSMYMDEGYTAVKVHAVESGNVSVAPDSINAPFSVAVEEGRIYKLGTVRLSSYEMMTQAELDKAVASFIQADVKGINPAGMKVKGLTLRSIWSFISSRYTSKGYLDCKLTPHPEFDDATATANYKVDIDPGPVYHLAFVRFDNVSDELRKLLMRYWQMLPGDPFNEGYVSNFIYSAQKSDPVLMRTLGGVKASYDVRDDPQTHEVNLVIHLERGS
jgi:outer membrane protein assembly factor BamA